ncbi:hypothetical protein [Methylobacterium nigriterrae]|uniref:hypothetical protein n=1 Tax=Methylobacterium nigriterrae TaxID=3127512 RepID=UPI00301360CF
MTDSGSALPVRPAARTHRARMLHRIADALDLPLADLYAGSPRRRRSSPSEAECAAMTAAFLRIGDPDARRRCLALLQALGDA